MNFHLSVCRPKGFLPSSSLDEVVSSVAWALSALGHSVTQLENGFGHPPTTNIIFYAGLLDESTRLPQGSIVYNFDNFAYGPTVNLFNIVKNSPRVEVWDYSERGVQEWQQHGVEAKFVPVGYTPNLTRIPKAKLEDIDVSFFGWMTPKRWRLAEDLQAAGLKIHFSNGTFGGARDEIISRSKVCLNVHHDQRYRFEIVRVSYLLANSKCVVSEIAEDQSLYPELCLTVAYDKLVEACRNLVFNDRERKAAEKMGFDSIRTQDYVETIRQAISEQSVHGPDWPGNPPFVASSKILERYQQACREGDMKDFAPLLRSLAKGKVLEIGVRDGASTSALLLGVEHNGGFLTSVDIDDCSHLWIHPQWEFVRAASTKLDIDPGTLDLALIDGDHSPQAFRMDLENCLKWVKPGGMILCHDISPPSGFTYEEAGGSWPSRFVGEEFNRVAEEKKLPHFVYPGAWGMGVIVNQ